MDKASLRRLHRQRFEAVEEIYESSIWSKKERRTFWELANWHKKRVYELRKADPEDLGVAWDRYLRHVMLENHTTLFLFQRRAAELMGTTEGRRILGMVF